MNLFNIRDGDWLALFTIELFLLRIIAEDGVCGAVPIESGILEESFVCKGGIVILDQLSWSGDIAEFCFLTGVLLAIGSDVGLVAVPRDEVDADRDLIVTLSIAFPLLFLKHFKDRRSLGSLSNGLVLSFCLFVDWPDPIFIPLLTAYRFNGSILNLLRLQN